MALLETYDKRKQPAGYDCPKYVPAAGGKRCRHYLDGGACALASEFMCVEWLKANGHPRPDAHPALTDEQKDLFGNPTPPNPKPSPPSKATNKTAKGSSPQPSPQQQAAHPSAPKERPPMEPVPRRDIESFKELGVEVCLRSEEVGEVWIVPEYTGRDRKEMSIEHAAVLSLVAGAFPGAKVVWFERLSSGASSPEPQEQR